MSRRRKSPGLSAHTAGGPGSAATARGTFAQLDRRDAELRAQARERNPLAYGVKKAQGYATRFEDIYVVLGDGNVLSEDMSGDYPIAAYVYPDGSVVYTDLGKLKQKAAAVLARPGMAAKAREFVTETPIQRGGKYLYEITFRDWEAGTPKEIEHVWALDDEIAPTVFFDKHLRRPNLEILKIRKKPKSEKGRLVMAPGRLPAKGRIVSKDEKFTMTAALKAAGLKSRGPSLAYRIGRDVARGIRNNPKAPTPLDIAATAALRLEDRSAVEMPRDPKAMAKMLAKVATVVGLGSVDDAAEGIRVYLGV